MALSRAVGGFQILLAHGFDVWNAGYVATAERRRMFIFWFSGYGVQSALLRTSKTISLLDWLAGQKFYAAAQTTTGALGIEECLNEV